MNSKIFTMQPLSMVASVLSGEYGVKVVSSGMEAFTVYPANSKPVINIPAVDMDDPNYWIMVRGFIDHEAGHIRFSRQVEGLPRLYGHAGEGSRPGALSVIFNLYEDVYVERMMGRCFPGCRRNFSRLVHLLYVVRRTLPLNVPEFLGLQAQIPMADVAESIWDAIFQYMTYFIRSREQPELENFVPAYKRVIDLLVPGLTAGLEPMMLRVETEGASSEANARLALQSHKIILDFFQDHFNVMPGALQEDGEEGEDLEGGKNSEAGGADGEKTQYKPSKLQQALMEQAEGTSSADKTGLDISEQAASMLSEMLATSGLPQPEPYESIEPQTHAWKAQIECLEQADMEAAVRAMAQLDAQLQALIQTFVKKRGSLAHFGRLDTNMLHRLAGSNPRIFRKQVEKQGTNTEIVLVADMSASMVDEDKDIITSRAIYAITASLRKIPGVASSVVGFSGNKMFNILGPDVALSKYMRLRPSGHTLCGEALGYAMRNFSGALDTRKIIFMLTDSKADNEDYFREMIRHSKAVGVEFLGIGILDDSILDYLPREECCVVKNLNRLAPDMFRMLRNKLLGAI
ncbi:MAG: VWA domain-containing protein [Desulfovibrionaceae bacterium]|nr:VWA domain-containing protein [Desulfovibrionaceae bacterium]